ncbi:replication initiator [Spongiactinospora sp. 9N601]|uniref:replication initiator n=1 Tax=Spongiactinospora sp. 9N601 TaxID=3375149 RepID=UPI003787689B
MPTSTANAHAIRAAITRLNHPDYTRWATQTRKIGGCRQPIHLRGKVERHDRATGALLHRYTTRTEPDGLLRVPCKTRRASRCPSCAETYRADTYHLIRAGLAGGKGVPETVTTHPTLFVTLTAPSFGPVHTRAGNRPCHPRLGEPLCPDCYDYTASVLFNALAPLLWKRFTDALRWQLAKLGGLTLTELRRHLVLSFAKVAEYQRRGVVHFHAIIRLDGPTGPTTTPPAWATADLLTNAVRHAATAVTATAHGHTLRWGAQLDIRPITMNGELTEQAVARYVAKYATKAAECVGTLDRRIKPLEDLTVLPIRPHARRLIAECLRLGALDDLTDLRLTAWAHMLGFRGHVSTRSRRYSTTLGHIRADRATHARNNEITTGRLPLFEEDTVLVVAEWQYAGRGYSSGDALIAASLTGKPRVGARL